MRVENLMFTERGVRQNINLCFGVYVLAFVAFMFTERTHSFTSLQFAIRFSKNGGDTSTSQNTSLNIRKTAP
jgi:hypothetical protein